MNTTRMSSRRAVLSVFMAVVLAVGMMPLPAYAAPTQPSDSGTQLQAAQLPDSLTEGGASELTAQDDDAVMSAQEDEIPADTNTFADTETRGNYGDGSEGNPYKINTKADLVALRTAVNSAGITTISYGESSDSLAAAYYKLISDLDFSGDDWTAIGIAKNLFAGCFDGNGHSITGVSYGNEASSTTEYVGVFGGVSAAYHDLYIKNLRVEGTAGGFTNLSTSTSSATGGIVGYIKGNNTMYPHTALIENCVSDIAVSGIRSTGGIAGQVGLKTTVNSCLALGDVTVPKDSQGTMVGGLAGSLASNGELKNSLLLGQVSGDRQTGNALKEAVNALVGKSSATSSEAAASAIVNNRYVAQTSTDVKAYSFSVSNVNSAVEPTEGMVVSKPTTAAEKTALAATMGWDSTNNALLIASLPPADSGDGGDTGDDEDEGPSIETYDPTAPEPSADDIAAANVTYLPEKTVTAGTSITLSVHATPKDSNNTLAYQWFQTTAPEDDDDTDMAGQSLSAQDVTADETYGGTAIENATNATYTVTAESTASYYCAVTEDGNTAYSPLAVITVQEATPAVTDTYNAADNPVKISTAKDLSDFRDAVNAGNPFEGKTVQLQNDIDLGGGESSQWTPIGVMGKPFKGTFDGQHNTISGLYINSTSEHQALFGYVSGATVRGLMVEGTVTGKGADVAGVIATNTGTACVIEEVGSSVTVKNDTSSSWDYTGGVIANALAGTSVSKCFNKGDVESLATVGGIVGYTNNTGTTVASCYNLGKITGTGSDPYAGGIFGSTNTTTISNCYNAGEINVPNAASSTRYGSIAGGSVNATTNNYFDSSKCARANGGNTQNAKCIEKAASGITVELMNADASDAWKDGTDINADSGTPALAWEPDVDDPNATHYDVTFNTHDGSSIESQSIQEGRKAKKPAIDPTKVGYLFDGWYTSDEYTTEYDFSSAVNSNLELHAKWAEAATITFNTNGGSAVDPITVKKGETATKPANPTKDNYGFDGWYSGEDLETAFDFTAAIDANKTLYAKWSPQVTLTIGTGTSSGYDAPYDTNYNNSTVEMVYSRDDVDEAGTITAIAFNVTAASSFATSSVKVYMGYKSADSFSSTSDYLNASDLTLVYSGAPTLAQSTGWETITLDTGFPYDPSSGNLAIAVTRESSSYSSGLKYSYSTKYGSVLKRQNDSSASYADITNTSNTFSSASNLPNIQINITPTNAPHEVTFNSNGGSAVAAQTVRYNKTATEPDAPTYADHTFKGWYSDSELQTPYDFTAGVTEDITLYAKWVSNVTVTFNANEGSAVDSQEVGIGDKATEPDSPTRSGYTFKGWYDQTLGHAYDFDTAVTENLTLYAKWVENVTVAFNSNEGSTVESQNIEPGTKATEPADPTRDGYIFKGWYDNTLTNEYDFDTAVSENTTLYAKWVEAVTVTFDTGEGGSTVASQTIEKGATATRPETDPTRNAYEFVNWYADGEYANTFDFGSAVNANITVYAKWKKLPIVEVEIGTGVSTSTYGIQVPIWPYYYNTASETIYTKDDIGTGGVITKMSYHFYAASTNITTSSFRIYLGHDTEGAFSSGSNNRFRTPDDLTLVYEGSPIIQSATTGWQDFEFNKATFDYNGSDNLLVLVIADCTSEASSTPKNYYTNTVEYYTIAVKTDTKSTYTDLASVKNVTTGEASYKRSDTRFTINTHKHVISGEPTFTWADDNESCTVSFTCTAEGCSGEDDGNDTYTATEDATVTSEVTKEATCSEAGSKTYTATYMLNGTEYTDTKTVELPIDPDNHNVTEWTVSADGTTKSGECSWCGEMITVPNASVWDGTASEEFSGTGTEEDPYLIASAADLAYLASQVNAGTSYSGKYFKQTIDINLDDKEWTAIGNQTNSFSGTYDGDEHSVSGLKISTATTGYQGLFGKVVGTSATNASIKNLVVKGDVTVGAYNYVAGVAGYAGYANFTNVGNEADVTAGGIYIGGIAGYAYYGADFEGCYNKAAVTSNASASYSEMANPVGGILGMGVYAARTLKNCYNLGEVRGTTGNTVGGLVGSTAASSTTTRYDTKFVNCYNAGTVVNGYYKGGLLGYGWADASSSNNFYLEQTNLSLNGRTADDNTYGTPKSDADMKVSDFVSTLGNAYKAGSTYPLLAWEAPAVVEDKAPVIEPYDNSATPTTEQIDNAEVTYLPSVTLTRGETIKLSVKATADSAMTYQWYTTSVPTSQSGQSVASMVAGAVGDLAAQADSTDPYGGTAIEGATAATYMVTADESAAYYCAVTSNGKTAYSTRAVITVEEETDPDNTFNASDAAPVITTQADLDAFAAAVNGGNSFSGKTVSIAANAADGLKVTSRIGSASSPFSGTFDGNGYKLNVLITGTDRQGLFGALIGTESNPATVKNLIITGAVTTTAVDDDDNGRAGGIAANASGVVVLKNVGAEVEVSTLGEGASFAGGLVGMALGPDYWTDGDLTIEGCYVRGIVSAEGSYAGGLVGCSSGNAKTTVKNSYVNAAVSAGMYAGGFFGAYEGVNWGSDLSGAVSNSYRTGTVAADSKAGAMVGALESITFTDVYNDSTDGAKHTGDGDDKTGVTNESAADLKGLAETLGASFKADATDAEKMINAGFPVLTWEDITATQPTAHNITVATGIEGGTVVAKPSQAAAGSSVAVMVTPDSTHTVGTVTYKPAGGDATEIEAVGGTYTFTMPDADVEVSATFAEKTAHAVTVDAGENGTASASPTSAVQGQTVTVTAAPASGYQVDEMTATDGESNAVSIEVDGNEGTFTMPDSAVTVSVTFKEYKPLRLAIAKDTTTYTPKASLLTGEQTQVGVSLHAYIDDAEVTQEAQIENLKLNWYAKGSETPDSSVTPELNSLMISYGYKTNTLKTTSFNFSKDAAGTYTYCAKATWTYTIDGTEYSAESDVLEWEFTVTEPVDLTQALKAGSDLEIASTDSSKWAVNNTEEGRSYIEAAAENINNASVTVTVPGEGWLLWDWKLGHYDHSTWPKAAISLSSGDGAVGNFYPFTDLESSDTAHGSWSTAVVKVDKAGSVTWSFKVNGNGTYSSSKTNTACVDNIRFVTELTPVSAGADEHATASVKVDGKTVTKVDPRQGSSSDYSGKTFSSMNGETEVTAAGNKKVTWTAEGQDGYSIAGWKKNLDDEELYAVGATLEFAPYDEATTFYAVSELPFEGAGTEENPFQIRTMADLNKLASIVAAGETFSGKYLKLACDESIDAEGASFAGIGTYSYPVHSFEGTFDGDDKEIKNIKLVQGLFGRVSSGGVVKNLKVSAVELAPTAHEAGIVAAELYGGTVSNVEVSGDVKAAGREFVGGVVGKMLAGSTVTDCKSSVNITASHSDNDQNLGGVVGTAYGTVSGCTFVGTIAEGGGNAVGGIAGSITNATQMSDCYVNSDLIAGKSNVGGIVGDFSSNQSKVENCEVFETTVKGTGSTGGIAGHLESGFNNTNGTVNACVASGTVESTVGAVGGIVGEGKAGSTLSNCVALQQTISGATAAGRIYGVAGGTGTTLLTPSGNYAWAGMKVGESGSEAAVAADDEDVATDKKHGAQVKTAELLGDTVPVAFTALTGWTKAAGAKPAVTGNSDSGTAYPDYIRNLTVTFDDGKAKTTQTVVYGEKATKPTDPERAGYEFVNWHAVGTDDAFDFDTAVKDDLTLVAKWEIDPASVTRTLTVVVSGLTDATAAVSVVDSEGAHISPATSENGTYTYNIGAGAYTVSASAEGYAKPADQTAAASESADGVTVEFKSWTPDASALDAAITAAQALYDQAKDGAKSADDVAAMAPGEKYYEKDKVDALAAAIASATEAKDSAETATAVKQAVDALQDAAAAVEEKTVPQPDKSALEDAIEAAEAAIGGVTGSTSAGALLLPDGTKWADAVALAAYRAAIEAAEAVLASDSASAADVAAAEAALAEPPAVSTVSVDRSALESAIEAADADLSGTEVASSAADVDEGEAFATQAQADALAAAIAKAETARAKASASQAEVDAARAELAAAQAAFDAAKGTGTKKSETPDEPETPAEKADGVVRLWGETALDTMAAIVEAGNYEAGGVVVLTTIDGYWDALTAAGAAGLAGAPVLMTDGGSLSAQTEAIIRGLEPSTVIVCGGPAAVSDEAASQALAAAARGAKLERFYGETAVGTACAIYERAPRAAGGEWASTAIVATNGGYWDALAAAPLSYALHMPIFLTDGADSISSEALAAMAAGGVTEAYIAGGEAAVSPDVEAQLRAAGIRVAGRLAGETAIETSEAVAQFGLDNGMTCDSMGVATNSGYWDALAGAALCGRLNSVLVLAGSASDGSVASGGFVDAHASGMDGLYIFGGAAAVDPSIESALKSQVD